MHGLIKIVLTRTNEEPEFFQLGGLYVIETNSNGNFFSTVEDRVYLPDGCMCVVTGIARDLKYKEKLVLFLSQNVSGNAVEFWVRDNKHGRRLFVGLS